MTNSNEEKKLIPPYLPYKTFSNFIDRLRTHMPSRIDRSLMSTFSGAVQAQLLSTLRYLELISISGIPTEKLHKLCAPENQDRENNMREVIASAYPFLFGNEIDLKRATYSHVQEVFEKSGGVTGGTVRKCIAFFVAMSKDAGIELSPHIKVKWTTSRSATKKNGTEKHTKIKTEPQEEEIAIPLKSAQTWEQILLSKFPGFDPAWPDDVKAKWFEGFKELMEHLKKG